MTERRSVSQILFGFLPQQTVDVRGGVWKVESWRGAINEVNFDAESLRRELCRLARPWQANGKDGDFVLDLEKKRAGIQVKTLDRERGVKLRPFPRIWFCGSCYRISDSSTSKCLCKAAGRKGQLQFVQYCDKCAELSEPYIPLCPLHGECRINFPGTATGAEVLFDCPTCGKRLREGFGFPRSACGSLMKANVHRAASVFTPRSVVIVNPPSRTRLQEMRDAGGAPRALGWVLSGMRARSMTHGVPSAEALRRQLLAQGLKPDIVERMLVAALDGRAVEEGSNQLLLHPAIQESAEEQALAIAVAVSESRATLEDLVARSDPGSNPADRYRDAYPLALAQAGLERVDLIDRFPVLSGHFAFTRGATDPGASYLSAFRNSRGEYIVYGSVAETEALFISLNPERVLDWLRRRGCDGGQAQRSAREAVLLAASSIDKNERSPVLEQVTELVHTYAHRLIRLMAVHAGIERNALSELLVPTHLGFFIYAATRGDFVLGGLQAVFEGSLDKLLREFVQGERRCALDPGCARGGGACIACLHLGETSCRLYNTKLDRRVLFGSEGYLRYSGNKGDHIGRGPDV